MTSLVAARDRPANCLKHAAASMDLDGAHTSIFIPNAEKFSDPTKIGAYILDLTATLLTSPAPRDRHMTEASRTGHTLSDQALP